MKLKYFEINEFDDKNFPGSGKNMDKRFLKTLDKIREDSGVKMRITSGYRTKETNDSLKHSVPNSEHLNGLAVDVATVNSSERAKIVYAAIKNNISRIGIGKSFVHLDMSETKKPALWHYYK